MIIVNPQFVQLGWFSKFSTIIRVVMANTIRFFCILCHAFISARAILQGLHLDAESNAGKYTGWFSKSYPNFNATRSIVVDGKFFRDPPGGVEALIQLSIALTHAVHNPLEVFVTDIDYHEKWRRLYGGSLITRTKSLHQLQKGDLFITNEGIGCFNHSPDVEVFVWILANYLGCKSGVRYISHNKFLTNYTFDDKYVRLPLERVINPYISQPIVKHAMKFSGLHSDGSIAYHRSQLHLAKANVVLTDNDISSGVFDVVRRVADKMGVKVINLMELNSTQLTQAYEQGKIIIDWCMRGSERCPMEAALYGAVLLTNNCETGSSFVDFPIPSKFILPQGPETIDNNDKELEVMLEKQFTDIFANYWDYVPMFEPLRRAILDRSPRNMVSDANRFLQTLHVTERSPQSEWLMLGGCKGC